MTYKAGRRKSAGQRTMNRLTSAAAKELMRRRVPVDQLTALQRLRYASDLCFALSDLEVKKGDRADPRLILELTQTGAMLAAKLLPYVRPKFVAVKFDASPPPRQAMDLRMLDDEELIALEHMLMKSQVTVQDDAEESPKSPDEYLALRECCVGKGDALQSVRKPADESDRKDAAE